MLTALTLSLLLAAASGAAVREKRQASGSISCSSTQTQITTPWVAQASGSCASLIGQHGDGYDMVSRQECQRWYGGALPDHAASNYVYACETTTTGIRYRAHVCCKGLITNRCFNCHGALDPYTCDYQNNLVTCNQGEVCSSVYTCSSTSSGIAQLSKKCMPMGTCGADEAANPSSCSQYYAQVGEQCTHCCQGSFCNFAGYQYQCYTPGGVVTPNPTCDNGGLWQSFPSSQLGYRCCCKLGYGGVDCQYKVSSGCSPDPCLNGGTCYNYGVRGQRCACPSGYVGDTCQRRLTLQCPGGPAFYFDLKVQGIPNYLNRDGATCASLTATVQADLKSQTSTCVSMMQGRNQGWGAKPFVNGVDGQVDAVISASVSYCSRSDSCTEYGIELCCPSCHSLPCQNGGRCTQKANNDYSCACRFGYSGRNCEKKFQICYVNGEPHYSTFDGVTYSAQTNCTTYLAMPSQVYSDVNYFQVRTKNEYRGGSTTSTYPQWVEVELGSNTIIRLDRGRRVYVNTVERYPDFSGPTYKVRHWGRYVRLDTDFGLMVAFDGVYTILVQVPGEYAGRMGGLCGNMDGNGGERCGGKAMVDTPQGHHDFATCWEVGTNTGSCGKVCTAATVPNPRCAAIMSSTANFGNCPSEALYDSFVYSCNYDTGACGDPNNFCQSVKAYADFCANLGHSVNYAAWRAAANCPFQCLAPMTKYTTVACHNTCDNPTGAADCTDSPMESCTCPTGQLLTGAECVTDCPCMDADGARHLVGTQFGNTINHNINNCTRLVCRSGPTIAPVQVTCPQVPCQWADWAAWTTCNQGSTQRTRTRTCNRNNLCNQNCVGIASDTGSCLTCNSGQLFNPAVDCQYCTLTRNYEGYLADPCTCGYYHCKQGPLGLWAATRRPCANCTCWDQERLTCVWNNELQPGAGCQSAIDPETIDIQPGYCTRSNSQQLAGTYTSRFRELADHRFYMEVLSGGREVKRPCAPGTVFQKDPACGCVHGVNVAAPRPELCLDFDDVAKPYDTGIGLWVDPENVQIRPASDCKSGRCAYFNGHADIEIPYFNNNPFKAFSWTLWYKRVGTANHLQGLLSNADCVKDSSMEIRSETGGTVGGGVRTFTTDYYHQRTLYDHHMAYVNLMVGLNSFHHVVMTYDGLKLKFYVDGVIQQPTSGISVQGATFDNNCPIVLGDIREGHRFTGYMDQVCFYKRALTQAEVTDLYQNPGNAVMPPGIGK